MDPLSERNQDLSTGLAEIDREHDLQIALLNQLRGRLERGDRAGAAYVTDQLADYSNVHFGSEEVLMRLHAYPRYHEHVEEHRLRLEQLAALRARIVAGTLDTSGLADSVRRWHAGHACGMDRDFAAFVSAGGETATD